MQDEDGGERHSTGEGWSGGGREEESAREERGVERREIGVGDVTGRPGSASSSPYLAVMEYIMMICRPPQSFQSVQINFAVRMALGRA